MSEFFDQTDKMKRIAFEQCPSSVSVDNNIFCKYTKDKCIFNDPYWTLNSFGFNGFICRINYAKQFFKYWWHINRVRYPSQVDEIEKYLKVEVPDQKHLWERDIIILKTLKD